MATDNYLRSYGDTSIATDVLDLIEQLSPQEDTLLTSLGKSTAYNTVHQWQTDTYASIGTSAVNEAVDASFNALITPVRVTNITEIVARPFSVSGTQRAVTHYGFGDAYSYQAMKAMAEWKRMTEYDLVRSTLTSGVSGASPKLAGVIAFISTNATAQTSGTVFSESIMNGLIQLSFDNGNNEVITDIYVGSLMKRKISTFSGRSGTQFIIAAAEREVVNTTAKYASDFGEHNIHLHRWVDISGTDSTCRVLGIVQDKWRVAYLNGRTPKLFPLAKVGDSDRGQVLGELTLEMLNEPVNFYASGYLRQA